MDKILNDLVFVVVQLNGIYVIFFLFTVFVWCYMRLFLLSEETEMTMKFVWAPESFESLILV